MVRIFSVAAVILVVAGLGSFTRLSRPAPSPSAWWHMNITKRVMRVTATLDVRFGQPQKVASSPIVAGGETSGGWVKHEANPVLGGSLGTVFDVSLLEENGVLRMWFSWRPKDSIALVESADGVHWSAPIIVLGPDTSSGWEDTVNRPVVVKRADGYHMWYTGQTRHFSWIGYATSQDGVAWQRASTKPVLTPDLPWEKVAVMCPHVIWDASEAVFKMWYSGGEQYEPDAIGYATSADGLTWSKRSAPVFRPSKVAAWESYKVTASQVIRHGDWYVMFYIGFPDLHRGHIGAARSRDGISGWERHPDNPIIRPGFDASWDEEAVYKPFALFDGSRWRLWYNGRQGKVEQIGLAILEDSELGFDNAVKSEPGRS
jgi:beta-1,2-mannobiose phosphorylase / 1,2-beta-oligomannan phosphorylase